MQVEAVRIDDSEGLQDRRESMSQTETIYGNCQFGSSLPQRAEEEAMLSLERLHLGLLVLFG
jgi:hypothetical protein